MIPNNLIEATLDIPLGWVPTIPSSNDISIEATNEQSVALGHCVQTVDWFMNPACRGVKFPCLVGRPGSGKSHVLKLACAYALSKGLKVELMSFTSERARKLGGNHLHIVFPLKVSKGRIPMSHEIATDCLQVLQSDPLKEAVIKRTDVFFFEEIGLLSSQLFSALDSISAVSHGQYFNLGWKTDDQQWAMRNNSLQFPAIQYGRLFQCARSWM